MIGSIWHTVSGRLMHARAWTDGGREGRAPAVLVHGLVISSRYMVPLARQLAQDTAVYAPDLPGFGASDKTAPALSVPEHADALAEWMSTIGLERAALIGNSAGCQVIAALAQGYSDLVERAVLVGPTVDPAARSFRRQLSRWLRDLRNERRSLDRQMVRDYAATGLARVIATIRFLLQDRIEERLPTMRMPTLIVRGELDPMVPLRWAEEATRLLPNGRLAVVPDAGHTLNYSAPEALARVVRPFLAEATNGRARERAA